MLSQFVVVLKIKIMQAVPGNKSTHFTSDGQIRVTSTVHVNIYLSSRSQGNRTNALSHYSMLHANVAERALA